MLNVLQSRNKRLHLHHQTTQNMATTKHGILGITFEIDNDTLKVISPGYDLAEDVLGTVSYMWVDICDESTKVTGAIYQLLTSFEIAGKPINAFKLLDEEKEFYFGDYETLKATHFLAK